MSPVNLENMTAEEFRGFVNSFDIILSDCDGVIWTFGRLNEKHSSGFRNTGIFFETMKKMGKKTYYVSNNSARSMADYQRRFGDCEIRDGLRDLITPPEAIADYLKSANFDKENKQVFCVSNKLAINALETRGYKCKHGPELGDEDFSQYYRYGLDDPEIGAVVFDADYRLNYSKLVMAATYLKRPDVLFLVGATDKFVAVAKDINILGVGQFHEIVGELTGRTPAVLGKPGREFGHYLVKRAGVKDPSRVLFIGDMLEQDIGQGKQCGFQTLLVLSTHSEQEMLQQKLFLPDFYVSALRAILPKMTSQL